MDRPAVAMDRPIVSYRLVGVAFFALVAFLMWQRPDARLAFGILTVGMLVGRDPWWRSHRRLSLRELTILAIVCAPIVAFALSARPFVQAAILVVAGLIVFAVKRLSPQSTPSAPDRTRTG